MSIGMLDLHDSNLQLWHQDTRVQSPGYALLQGSEYRFGAPARATARLRPREINTRFWWQLSTETLQPALGPARHTGDLVHAHLRQLHQEAKQPDEVLLAVSGSMQHEQLALLLGIVQQCPFDAVGLVNRSVALGSLYGRSERLFHLEIQLHQALVSELAVRNDNIDLQRTTPLPGCGLLQLQERLVEIIAAEFVRQTRFDPRHKAATEQQLYDALPAALRTLQARGETNVDVNGYQARIGAQQLQAAGQRLFQSARECMGLLRPDDHVIADPLAALLPGLGGAFARLDILDTNDVCRALQMHQGQLIQRQQALSFVTTLPCLEQKIIPKAESPGAHLDSLQAMSIKRPNRPTHVLYRHVAQPLREAGTALADGYEIFHSKEGWQLRGGGPPATVNGSAYRAGQILANGDSIVIVAGEPALLIEVVT